MESPITKVNFWGKNDNIFGTTVRLDYSHPDLASVHPGHPPVTRRGRRPAREESGEAAAGAVSPGTFAPPAAAGRPAIILTVRWAFAVQ